MILRRPPDGRGAGHRARHGPRAPGHLRAGRDRRPGAPHAAHVHRRVGARRAVLRDGAGRRHPRRQRASRPGYADEPDAAPRRRRAARRRAGRPALGRLRRPWAWATSAGPRASPPARCAAGPSSGTPPATATGPDLDALAARLAETVPPPSGRASSTATTGWTTACSTRTTPGPHQGGPRLGDVDAGRPADRPRHDVRLLAGGRRGARLDAEPGDHAARLPDPPRGRRAVRRSAPAPTCPTSTGTSGSPSSSSPRSSPGSSPGRPPAPWPARTPRATPSASTRAWSWDAPRWTTVRSSRRAAPALRLRRPVPHGTRSAAARRP